MWFSNLYFYQLKQPLTQSQEEIERLLGEMAFSPCGSQDLTRQGWTSPLGKNSDMFTHIANNNLLLCLKKEEKLIPASVIKDQLEQKVAEIEEKESRPVKKAEKTTLKEEIVVTLLPRAFSRSSLTWGYVNLDSGIVAVAVSSASKAEDFLAHLRKSLGSLPVVPVTGNAPTNIILTEWLKTQELPPQLTLETEAELKEQEEDGAIVKLKHHDLSTDEVMNHLENGKMVVNLGLKWQDKISFVLNEDMSLKRLKYSDYLKEQNEDIPKEDMLAKIDADFTLVTAELNELITDLANIVGFSVDG